MIKAYTKEQRKQINTIMNVDDKLVDEEDVVRVALDFLSQMCEVNAMHGECYFYIDNDDEGNIKLEVEV